MTGLVTLNTDEQWTAGGQVVLLERSAPEARLEKIYGATILVMGSERDLERFATLT